MSNLRFSTPPNDDVLKIDSKPPNPPSQTAADDDVIRRLPPPGAVPLATPFRKCLGVLFFCLSSFLLLPAKFGPSAKVVVVDDDDDDVDRRRFTIGGPNLRSMPRGANAVAIGSGANTHTHAHTGVKQETVA